MSKYLDSVLFAFVRTTLLVTAFFNIAFAHYLEANLMLTTWLVLRPERRDDK